jgi:hypothetical protein
LCFGNRDNGWLLLFAFTKKPIQHLIAKYLLEHTFYITTENFIRTIDLDDYFFQLAREKSQIISFEIEFFHRDTIFIMRILAKKRFAKNCQNQVWEK